MKYGRFCRFYNVFYSSRRQTHGSKYSISFLKTRNNHEPRTLGLDGSRGGLVFGINRLPVLGMVRQKIGIFEKGWKKVEADTIAAQDKDENEEQQEAAGFGLVRGPFQPFAKNRR
jgi:hypothetical protein